MSDTATNSSSAVAETPDAWTATAGSSDSPASLGPHGSEPLPGTSRQILPAVFFTFLCYLTVGIPLAILPTFVHLRLGFGTILAGLVISMQYIATVASRPRAGRMTDVLGPKRTVIYGLIGCAGSGLATAAAAFATRDPRLCLALLTLGRLFLGTGESMVATGAIMWGIGRAGIYNTAQVIAWNGVATYAGLAIGAPLGILLEADGGLPTVGLLVAALSAIGVFFALRLARVPVKKSPQLPFIKIFMRVAPHGVALALGGIGFGVLATFVTLYFAKQHWAGAALALSLYGACFIVVRLIFYPFITRYGGFPPALVSLAVETFGLLLLAFAHTRLTAFLAAGLIGCGFSLVFPALAVEAVRHIPLPNRGTALGAYNVFVDFSLFLTGPIAGAIIARYNYSAAFLTTAVGVVIALATASILYYRERATSVR